jgi:hypothetical protein
VFWGFLAETGLTGVLHRQTGVESLYGSRQVSPAGTGLTGGAHRSDRCWSVDSSFGVPLRSRVCEVGSWFLGSVALQWLRGLGQLG